VKRRLQVLKVRPAEIEPGDTLVFGSVDRPIQSVTLSGTFWSLRDAAGDLIASRPIWAIVPVYRWVDLDECDPHGIPRRFTVVPS